LWTTVINFLHRDYLLRLSRLYAITKMTSDHGTSAQQEQKVRRRKVFYPEKENIFS